MSHVLGHIYRVEWSNPYTEPPAGQPRILAEIYVPEPRDVLMPPEIEAMHRIGSGYSITIRSLVQPPVERSPEAKAATRQKLLRNRMEAKYPLLADDMIAQDIARKPDYYLDGTSDRDAAKAARIAAELEEIAYLTANANRLIVYGTI